MRPSSITHDRAATQSPHVPPPFMRNPMLTEATTRRCATALLTALAALSIIAGGARAAEEKPRLAPACAARDMNVTTLIEYHGEAQAVSSARLAEAAFKMFEARNACYEGRVN